MKFADTNMIQGIGHCIYICGKKKKKKKKKKRSISKYSYACVHRKARRMMHGTILLFNYFVLLPWAKILRQPRIMMPIGRCSIAWYCASITDDRCPMHSHWTRFLPSAHDRTHRTVFFLHHDSWLSRFFFFTRVAYYAKYVNEKH